MKEHAKVKLLFSILFLAIGACMLGFYLYYSQYIASGRDIWGHLFKSDLLYQNLKRGNTYPMYTSLWYNGIQPFRYWAPFPYYVMAGLQGLAGGNIQIAYCLFGALSFFVGGIGWLLWGVRTKRYMLCTIIGMLWFFMPENIRVFLGEGNLPRMVTAFLIPYLAYFIWRAVRSQKVRYLVGVCIITMLITLSHAMIAAMAGIMVFVFLLFDSISNHKWNGFLRVIISMLLSFAICGIWLLPALKGGLVGMDNESSASVMKSLAYSLNTSLDPTNRINGIADTFYYGISFLVLSFLGILLGKAKRKAGFFTTILILLLTTPAFVPVLSKIPLSQLLWMMRFATLAYAFFLWSWIEWKSLKKGYSIAFIMLLVIDCIPSFNFKPYYIQASEFIPEETKLLKEATTQRATNMDVSLFGCYPSWELGAGEKQVPYSFGWAWQGATTASNIVLQNTSLENERYLYMFDRCVELGDDTVLYDKSFLGKNGGTKEKLLEAANLSGYVLINETEQAYLFHKETPKTFGVITQYAGISIGKYGSQIGLYYPSITNGDSNYLDDYSYDELKQYKTIFLSGFEYHSRTKAEELVQKLGDNGVRVVIDMTHLPVDKKINRMHFLDVYMQDISFSTRYPVLHYNSTIIYTLDFAKEYKDWNTGYIEGVKNSLGTFTYSDQELCFLGTNENENIIFTGLNLLFHAMETDDENLIALFSDLLQLSPDDLPSRECVPITVAMDDYSITIESEYDSVNTTLAALDTFACDQPIIAKNNLLYVNKGTTVIHFKYPSFIKGLIVSVSGLIVFVLFMIYLRYNERRKESEHE